MLIKRLRVEEGFFNLLDLQFSDGLNVLVGGRGVGKTSIIELLRFGLGVSNLSANASKESSAHAISILQSSGRVIIDVELNGQTISVTRAANEPVASNIDFIPKPIVFSQKEIETISLNSEGKINLIDSFASSASYELQEIAQVQAKIRSLYASLMGVKKELDEANEFTFKKTSLQQQENELIAQQKNFEVQNNFTNSNQERYSQLEKELNLLEIEINRASYLLQIFESRLSQVKTLQSRHEHELGNLFNLSSSNELYKSANKIILDDNITLDSLIKKNEEFISHIQSELNNLHHKKNKLEEEARHFRGEISKVTESAGLVLSKLSHIRSQLSQVLSWEQIVNSKNQQLSSLYNEIQTKLNELSALREGIYTRRRGIVDELNQSLNPFVRIDIQHTSEFTEYANALKLVLKGSGLRYNEIVDDLCTKVHPQWLFYYSFTDAYQDFSDILGMPIDRAMRLLSYLKEVDLGELLTTKVDDKLDFYLLDKGSYKRVEELSIGQRCTVALSIILENRNRVLIIDQPEDHLDNEFIAQTLISSLTKRVANAQTILSSHNANIPVLGNANLVVNLDSNGRKGFIKHIGSVQEPHVRSAIESIMEGGKQAFQRRSMFYSGN